MSGASRRSNRHRRCRRSSPLNRPSNAPGNWLVSTGGMKWPLLRLPAATGRKDLPPPLAPTGKGLWPEIEVLDQPLPALCDEAVLQGGDQNHDRTQIDLAAEKTHRWRCAATPATIRWHSKNSGGSRRTHPVHNGYRGACVDNGHCAAHRHRNNHRPELQRQYPDRSGIETDKTWNR